MEIEKILSEHKLFLSGKGGARADLSGADLRCADLSGADLSGADLSDVVGDGNAVQSMSLLWNVVFFEDWILIGCQKHTATDWATFSDEAISGMAPRALAWWVDHKPLILGLHAKYAESRSK